MPTEPPKFPTLAQGLLQRVDKTIDCGYAYTELSQDTRIRLSFWLAGVGYRRYLVHIPWAGGLNTVWSQEEGENYQVQPYRTITPKDYIVLPADDKPVQVA